MRRRVVVDGRVQGVFFRETCRREADSAGVTGWVKNRPDGKVEAVSAGVTGWVKNRPDGKVEAAFEGPPEAVERLVAWCRQGPPSARVSGVDVHEEAPQGERRFRVLDD